MTISELQPSAPDNKKQSCFEHYERFGITVIHQLKSSPQIYRQYFSLTDVWAFLFIEQGTLQLNINEKDFLLKKHDLLFSFNSHFITDVKPSNDFNGTIVFVHSQMASELIHSNIDMMRNLFYTKDNPLLHLEKDDLHQFERYLKLLHHLWDPQRTPSAFDKEIIHSITKSMLYEWANLVQSNIPENSEDRVLKQSERLFKNFMFTLTNDQVKSRSVTDYANRLCVTPKYLSAVCKQITGKTASSYINFYIIKDIKHLLKYSDKSIKEIAQSLGFPNLSFFGKYVKAHLGVSPSSYRKNKK